MDAPFADRTRRRLLSELSQRLGGADVALVDSGTSALSLAIEAALQVRGGAVAIPAYACFDLATAVDAVGCPFVLYDLDPDTLGPDPASLAAALGVGVGAVVVVHLYGHPVDMGMVRRSVAASGALVIEDAAQGAGGSLDERPLGALGDVGILSFGRGKGLTGGGGGAVVIPHASPLRGHPLLASPSPDARSSIRTILATVAQWILARPALFGIPASLPFLGIGETRYRSPEPKEGMAAFCIGVLDTTLRTVAEEARVRKSVAERLAARLRHGRLTAPRAPAGAEPGFLRFPALLPAGSGAGERAMLPDRLGIHRGYPLALPDLPGFGERRLLPTLPLVGARTLADRLVTLPTHGALEERDVVALLDWIRAFH